MLEQIARDKLTQHDLQTAGALIIGRNPETSKDVTQVWYPCTFMNIPEAGGTQRQYEDFAMAATGYFLKKTPFGKGEMDLVVPSR